MLLGGLIIFIIKEKKDIFRIMNYFSNNNLKTENYLFFLAITTGLPISELVKIRKKDVVKGNEIVEFLIVKNRKFYFTKQARMVMKKVCSECNGSEYVFLNNSLNNKYDRSQFYKKIREAGKYLKVSDILSCTSCQYTFAYHYLLGTGDINYLCKLFGKTKTTLIRDLFENNVEFEDYTIEEI
ncbi:tyrosine-type recombinase/integrase [Amedibacillus sp. YH-ame10]